MSAGERQAPRASSVFDDARLVLIARRAPSAVLLEALGAFAEAGLRHVEITLDSDDACATIRRIRGRFPGMAAGAGTVRSAADVARAAEAGAQFAVSPHGDPALASAARAAGIPYVPGAFTPTEILAAWSWGVPMVKLFPIAPIGSGFLRQLRGPIPDVPLIVTGGVTGENAVEYRRAGATAVGMGSELLRRWRDGDDRDHLLLIEQLRQLIADVETVSA